MFNAFQKKPSSEEKVAAAEMEAKLMAEMHNRMIRLCSKKCIPNDYREADLNKGESVCLDRCAAKFFDTHQRVSEQMQEQQRQQQVAAGGAKGFGL